VASSKPDLNTPHVALSTNEHPDLVDPTSQFVVNVAVDPEGVWRYP
jgi:hypothetical protein